MTDIELVLRNVQKLPHKLELAASVIDYYGYNASESIGALYMVILEFLSATNALIAFWGDLAGIDISKEVKQFDEYHTDLS